MAATPPIRIDCWPLRYFGIANANIFGKVYFPRLVLPLSKVFAGLIDFAIGFVILLGMMAWYGVAPTIGLLFLPVFLAWCRRSGSSWH